MSIPIKRVLVATDFSRASLARRTSLTSACARRMRAVALEEEKQMETAKGQATRVGESEPGCGAWNADAQLGGFAAIADRRRPVDEGERRHDRDQREDADDDVVGSGFHSGPYATRARQDRAGAPACP